MGALSDLIDCEWTFRLATSGDVVLQLFEVAPAVPADDGRVLDLLSAVWTCFHDGSPF
jgi:hypothetical protein